MTAGAGTGSANHVYSKYRYDAVPWTADNFHAACSVTNYDDAANVQLCELSGLADLRTEDTVVRERLADYLISLQMEGVAGFRIDAAKHMQPRDIDAILAKVNAAAITAGRVLPYVFMEVINNPGESVTAQQYFGVGYASGGAADVTDFLYGYRIADAFLGRSGATLASLQTLTDGLLPSDKSVVFVDNHDNQRGDNLYYASANNAYELANIFMLAHPQGAPSVMSSYGFDRGTQAGKDAGPPASAGGATQSTFDANGSRCTKVLGAAQVGSWICEHRSDAIAAMVVFRNATAGTALVNFQTINGNSNSIAFARDGKGYVVLNLGAQFVYNATSMTLPQGRYCNVAVDHYSPAPSPGGQASCSGATIDVASGGSAAIAVPANSAVVLHIGAAL
jgi:alpha-amylase